MGLKEHDIETIIAKYPEVIEEGLSLIGRQVNICGKFIDLLFEDRFGQKVIVEVKLGTIIRKHVAQLMDYEGHLLTPDDPTIRVMLVGNRVPENFRRTLDHHGFEWKELQLNFLSNFLKERDESELLARFLETEESIKTSVVQKTGGMVKVHKGVDPAQERRNREPTYANTSQFCRLPYSQNQNYRIDKALEDFRSVEELTESTGCTVQRIKSHISYIRKNCPHAIEEKQGSKIRFVLKDLHE